MLVAFGTDNPEASRAFGEIEKRVREKYSGVEVRWAFSSVTMRSRLAAAGKPVDSPETALSRLMDAGYNQVALLSLHVVHGMEFEQLARNAAQFAGMSGGFQKILTARPLLGNHVDMSRVARILCRRHDPRTEPGTGVVFIGHGNKRHHSDAVYMAMNALCNSCDKRVFVGTVEGHPNPDELIPALQAAGIRRVRLVPLMTVAGGHVRKDMAGDGPQSWKSILEKNEIVSEPLFSGLAEDPDIVSIWLEHLDEVFSKL